MNLPKDTQSTSVPTSPKLPDTESTSVPTSPKLSEVIHILKNIKNWITIYNGGINQNALSMFKNVNGKIKYTCMGSYLGKAAMLEFSTNKLTSLDDVIIPKGHVETTSNYGHKYGIETEYTFSGMIHMVPYSIDTFLDKIYPGQLITDERLLKPGTQDPIDNIIIPMSSLNHTQVVIMYEGRPACQPLMTGQKDMAKDYISRGYILDIPKMKEFINKMLDDSARYYPDIDLNQYRF